MLCWRLYLLCYIQCRVLNMSRDTSFSSFHALIIQMFNGSNGSLDTWTAPPLILLSSSRGDSSMTCNTVYCVDWPTSAFNKRLLVASQICVATRRTRSNVRHTHTQMSESTTFSSFKETNKWYRYQAEQPCDGKIRFDCVFFEQVVEGVRNFIQCAKCQISRLTRPAAACCNMKFFELRHLRKRL